MDCRLIPSNVPPFRFEQAKRNRNNLLLPVAPNHRAQNFSMCASFPRVGQEESAWWNLAGQRVLQNHRCPNSVGNAPWRSRWRPRLRAMGEGLGPVSLGSWLRGGLKAENRFQSVSVASPHASSRPSSRSVLPSSTQRLGGLAGFPPPAGAASESLRGGADGGRAVHAPASSST